MYIKYKTTRTSEIFFKNLIKITVHENANKTTLILQTHLQVPTPKCGLIYIFVLNNVAGKE